MKTFIITLLQNKHSVESAERARQSAVDVGYRETIETFEAITPDLWEEILPYDNNFDNYARPENVGACFASHYLLWQKCIELGEPILILEHDAIFVNNLPDIDFDMCVNFGRPSYIRPYEMTYKEPIEGLQSPIQYHFLGHHAYAIKPQAAKILCNDVKYRELWPNDVWMDLASYPWLQEYIPYPIVADTLFSTIQTSLDEATPVIKKFAEVTKPNSPERAYVEKYFPQALTPQSQRHIEAVPRKENFVEIRPGYLQDDIYTWMQKPIENNKYLIVSWRLSGSEFGKEVLRENFPEVVSQDFWAKTHITLGENITKPFIEKAKTKVFVIITDPREIAMNLIYFDNRIHLHDIDYENVFFDTFKSVKFLNEIAQKQLNLISHYKEVFGDNCAVLRYEDAVHNQEAFLEHASNVLGVAPLGIDDARKYKRSIYKNVGDFAQFFDKEILDKHSEDYQWFYDEYGYGEGLQELKYNWHSGTSSYFEATDNYKDMLKRNGVRLINDCCFTYPDKGLYNRTKNINGF